MTRDELEAAIKTANLWSGRATLILALGILGEYVLLPFLEKKTWLRPAKIFCAILVVAGIIGEYEFSSQISQHADELQRISDGELKNATDKAALAQDRADRAETQSGIAITNAARLNKEAAQLRKAAEDEHSLSLKIQKQLSWRDLSLAQMKRIAARLMPFAGQQFEMVTYSDRPEPANFTSALATTAFFGFWVRSNRQFSPISSLIIGVQVNVSQKSDQRTRDAAAAFQSALVAENVSAVLMSRLESDNPPPAGLVLIDAGNNPDSVFPVSIP